METNSEEVEHIHQKLMNKAYELWQKEENNNLKYSDFLDMVSDELGENYFHAVITGNLIYQVENGGFSQWYDNKYHVTIDGLRDFFESNFKNDSKEIKQIEDILSEVEEILNWLDDGKDCLKNIGYEFREFFYEKLEEKVYDELSSLDDKFYKISEKLKEILEEYFKNKI